MKPTITSLLKLLAIIMCISTLSAQVQSDSLHIVKEALQLIELSEPQFDEPFTIKPSPKDIEDLGFEQPNISEPVIFNMEDGINIIGQKYTHASRTTVILVHGVLANSYTYNKMSGLLRKALNAEIIAIDLRGHGQSGGAPGDISKPNQYAEDLNAVITSIKSERPDHSIILAGHSMGGGIILRHAESFPNTKIDGYVLFAPNLGANSPTTSQEIDLKNNFVKTHLSRGLGLKMLNELGIHTYDSLKVVFYNLPKQMPIKSYSYRSMLASYPKNFKKTLQKMKVPLIALVGSKDEAFIAEEYPIVFTSYSNGDCYLFEGETHNGIRHNTKAFQKINEWAIKEEL
jgi:alpha-beta hydrolase superfamily lysophospholipase